MDKTRMLLDRAQLGNGDAPRSADAAQIVADQVHDHHVLGVVLLQQIAGGAAGSLDGLRSHRPSAAAQIELRRSGRHLDVLPGETDDAGLRRGIVLPQRMSQTQDIGVR